MVARERAPRQSRSSRTQPGDRRLPCLSPRPYTSGSLGPGSGGDVHALGETRERIGGLASLRADPAEHELAGEEVVADLLWGELLGVEDDAQGFVGAVPRGQRAGDFQSVADS